MTIDKLMELRPDYITHYNPAPQHTALNFQIVTYPYNYGAIEFVSLYGEIAIIIITNSYNRICRNIGISSNNNVMLYDYVTELNFNRIEGERIGYDKIGFNIYQYIYPDAIYYVLPYPYIKFLIRNNFKLILKNLWNEIFRN